MDARTFLRYEEIRPMDNQRGNLRPAASTTPSISSNTSMPPTPESSVSPLPVSHKATQNHQRQMRARSRRFNG
jgi:hypothetical protein